MKSYLLDVWNAIDPIYYNLTRLQYVPENDNRNTLFRVRVTRYKGKQVVLSDGTVINKNDLLLKIHLHNVRMLTDLHNITSDVKRAVYVYHMIKRSLPWLANYVGIHKRKQEIKAIIGITTLYRGADRLGFEITSIKNPCYSIVKKGSFLPINFLANASCRNTPVYLFMSKERLLALYNV
ncbi:YkoP family protein [Virgibacillus oceani]|uniref:YkoP-like domain-containing protein n=1 Tax=Virgibacillus oceani TaxID=1479511 RepID=A0A917H4M1_9BACI|nr:hypothetical protein [Virgibacillus oceani]GGG67255.1 hypothetical protein GCM10011398_08710 [Virgibacillus oceani]